MKPYTPGEQPRDQQYNKLNTNESPFPPSPRVVEVVSQAQVGMLNLYSDPTCKVLEDAIAKFYGVEPENVTSGNGSDEVLAFAFRAFAGEGKPIAYADITYGCYKTWAALFGIESKVIPLREDFTVNVDDYMDFPGVVERITEADILEFIHRMFTPDNCCLSVIHPLSETQKEVET